MKKKSVSILSGMCKLIVLTCIYISILISFTSILGLKCEANAASLYYILDGSGSMWGRVDGQIKIEAARDAMKKLINEMPEELLCSLTVYGHLKKGDCSDITEIIPLGKVDRLQAIDLIGKITPKGKTPIAAAIEKVAHNIKNSNPNQTDENDNTIVLISDGIETCQGDPCALTAELKSSGIKFVLHVVGFDVDKEASKELACIAQAGGGRYFSTTNSGELVSILSAVQKSVAQNSSIDFVQKVEESKTKKIEEPITTTSKSIKIKAKGPGKIAFKYDSWVKKPYSWRLIDPETGEDKGKFSTLETTLVAPGYYQLVWDQSEHDSSDVALTEVIRVESGKTVEISLMTAINPMPADWMQNKVHYWGLKNIKDREELGQLDSTSSNSGSDEFVAWFGTTFVPQLVPSGRYYFVYDLSEHGSSDSILGEVEVVDGKMNDFHINTGVRLIPAEGMKPPYFVEFIEIAKDGVELNKIRLNGSFGPIALKPGKYKINYRQEEHGASTITIVDEFELEAGNLVEIEI
ncbi:MAG: VWA domain-containing protein [Desulfamplus sp.]|nr:VWA domain-containing protein [Desulfamplus sp.]